MDIASSNQYQTIELVSCDKAGNISKEVYDPETNEQVPASYKVLVTQNSFVQFINNTPLLISVIVIFVANRCSDYRTGKTQKKTNRNKTSQTKARKRAGA